MTPTPPRPPATRDGDSALARVLALLRELEDLGVVQVVGVVLTQPQERGAETARKC